MTAANPEFHFDFGSPNAYLAHRLIPGVQARTGTKFTYVPILLGGVFKATNNRSPMAATADIPAKRAFMAIEMARFIKRHAITDFRMNPHFPVNTLLLMRTATAARFETYFADFVNTVFYNMWSDPRKMDDPETVHAVLAAAGLPADLLLERAQSPDIKAELAHATTESVARGTFGAPTFFVGNEIFFGKDQLRDVEEALPLASAP